MSIFDKMFPNPLPKGLTPVNRQEAERLILELIGVGKKDGFLSEHPGGQFDFRCHNLESRRIGQRLNETGRAGAHDGCPRAHPQETRHDLDVAPGLCLVGYRQMETLIKVRAADSAQAGT